MNSSSLIVDKPLHDIKGYPIHPGDLVRTYHFTGRRNKVHYLYHVAKKDKHGLRMLPTEWLGLNNEQDGGAYYPTQKDMDGLSGLILSGHSVELRKRVKP